MALIVVGVALTVLGGPVGGLLVYPVASGAGMPRLGAGTPIALINLGMLVLIITPVARVASTVVFFFSKRDLPYLAITGYVLLVLLAGLLLGATE